ncbi:MAG: SRPBCC domain-containing protein [Candidatus Marinimicrobia bacterium]|nr:SRPBCC domain-containing protein [Candidatus Neomarinimicrobiota bacterium]
MKEIHTEIEINASPERIWKVLTDFPAYPEWNPFVREIDGQLVTGAKLKVLLQPPGGKGMTFRPKVLKVEPNREFRWLGHLLIHGLFDGEHFFIIEALDLNRVRFIHGEIFRGILVPLFGKMLDGSTRQGFEAFNQALRTRVEEDTLTNEGE